MNLPILNSLRTDQSTYICFTKALVDFDKAIATGNKCYFTKVVALNLPDWNHTNDNNNFFIDLSQNMTNSGLDATTPPNLSIPKMIQYYMENIIRQLSIGLNDTDVDQITEIAFWKMLNMMGLSQTQYKQTVTFINSIASSNFTSTDNNNGWNEIICQIPNNCKLLIPAWKTLTNINDVVTSADRDTCMFDNGNYQFEFAGFKDIIDFDNCAFDAVTQQNFDFNILLLYYTDETGINKLHGINFIYPYVDQTSFWNMIKFTQKTNIDNTIGYQFKFNQKSCNNEATQIAIYAQDDHTHWNTYFDTLSKLNSFLEVKMREANSEIN
jgi:hypothetical protein